MKVAKLFLLGTYCLWTGSCPLSTLAQKTPAEMVFLIVGGCSGGGSFFPLPPPDPWVSGNGDKGLTKGRLCRSARTWRKTSLRGALSNRRAWGECLHPSSAGWSVSSPAASFHVLSMLTTQERQQTFLKMTVIFRERKMANMRQKKYEVNFSPWRAREIIRVIWQPQSPGVWPAFWLSHCYLYEPGCLPSARVEIRRDLWELRYGPKWQKPANPYICLLKFWIPHYPPIIHN